MKYLNTYLNNKAAVLPGIFHRRDFLLWFMPLISLIVIQLLVITFLHQVKMYDFYNHVFVFQGKGGLFYDRLGNPHISNMLFFCISVSYVFITMFIIIILSFIDNKINYKLFIVKRPIQKKDIKNLLLFSATLLIGILFALPGDTHGIYGEMLQSNILFYTEFFCSWLYLIFISLIIAFMNRNNINSES